MTSKLLLAPLPLALILVFVGEVFLDRQTQSHPSVQRQSLRDAFQQQQTPRTNGTRGKKRTASRRPPLGSLIHTNHSIIGDVQFLLDFAIVGFPKCGTTTLMYASNDTNQNRLTTSCRGHNLTHSSRTTILGTGSTSTTRCSACSPSNGT